MAYTWWTPKYDFIATDGLTNNHMNAIGENIATLHSGNGQNSVSNLTVAADLPIGVTEQFFYVGTTGGSYIWRLQFTDGTTTRINGNTVWIYFSIATTLGSGHGTSGNYYQVQTYDSLAWTVPAGSLIGFILLGTNWLTIGDVHT